MKESVKTLPSAHTRPSSIISLLSGWVQQGVESFLATQRILVDLAMRQNLSAMKTLRDGLSHPEHSPTAILTDLAAEGTASFIEAQKILLNLAHRETEIFTTAVKDRVDGYAAAGAMTDLVRRSVDTFVAMQEDFLGMAKKHTHDLLHAVKTGKGMDGTHLIELARDAMDTFVDAQKKFLDVVAEESARMTGQKPVRTTKHKKTELSKLAREAADCFIEAQKKLLDVAGEQMNMNLEAANRAMDLVRPLRMPLASFTGDGLKNFVEAEKALIDTMIKGGKTRHRPEHKAARHRKAPQAQAAHAGAA